MQFIHTDLGNRHRGEIVQVTLTRAANVRLMNTSNYSQMRYQLGSGLRIYAGLMGTALVPIAEVVVQSLFLARSLCRTIVGTAISSSVSERGR